MTQRLALVALAAISLLLGKSSSASIRDGFTSAPPWPAAGASIRQLRQQMAFSGSLSGAALGGSGRNVAGRLALCQRAGQVCRPGKSFAVLQRKQDLAVDGSSISGSGRRRGSVCAAGGLRASAATSAKDTQVEDTAGDGGDSLYKGYHHVELWVGNAMQAASFFITRLGFEPVAYRGLETGSRNVATHVVKQGECVFAFSSPLEPANGEMSRHMGVHGDAVKDVSMIVTDCKSVFDEAVKNGAEAVKEPETYTDEHGSVTMATIKTYGDTEHTFIERGDYNGPFLPGFIAVTEADPLSSITACPKLEIIDHVVGNQPDREMEDVCEWYTNVLGWKRFWSVDDSQVVTKYSSLRSVVMTDPGENVKMPINEPADGIRKSQIQEYVEYNGGPGVQHIALRTEDILHTVSMLRERGVKFLKVPKSYYDDLRMRLGESSTQVAEDLDEIERLNLLCDFDEGGYLLQIFMKPIQDRPTLFLEVIQRRNHQGFGVGNFKALFEAIEREQENRGNL